MAGLRVRILLAMVVALPLAGCDLYSDDNDDDYWPDDYDNYNPPYPDGGPVCSGEVCGLPPGAECADNEDCGPGCYCSEQYTCEWSGYCVLGECPGGFVCDDRNTCVPDDVRGCVADSQCPLDWECNLDDGLCYLPTCAGDGECDAGEYCDEESGACIESGSCASPGQDTCAEGFECDTSRESCMPDDGVCSTDAECPGQKCNTGSGACENLVCSDYTDPTDCFNAGCGNTTGLVCWQKAGATGPCVITDNTPNANCECNENAFICTD